MTEGICYERGKESEGMNIEFIDIKRAYLQAPARRTLYVQLPLLESEYGKCAKVNKAMYGTRDAAQNWECEYRTAHDEWGLIVGTSSPCVMYHKERIIRLVADGDDYTAFGKRTRIWIGIVRLSPPLDSKQR